MYVDSHCHLFNENYENLEKLIKKTIQEGIKILIVNGIDKKTNEEVLKIIDKYKEVYGTLGYHPCVASLVSEKDLKYIENNLSHPKIIGIGEIGLDYKYQSDDFDTQRLIFDKQLKLAQKYKLPVIIHNREATADLQKILNKYKVKGIMHCFSENEILASQFIKQGFYLGIGGLLTFKNSPIKEVIKNVSLNYLITETDSPYMSPEPFRGKTNNPKNVKLIVKKIADLKEETEDNVKKKIYHNTIELFDKIKEKW